MSENSMLIEYRWLIQSFLTLLVVLGYFFILRITSSLIRDWASEHKKHKNRVEQVVWLFKIILSVVLVFAISMVWGVDYKGLWVVTTSVLAVLGVALFAQWSILSNLTSGVIVFFNFPAKVGDTIEIIDGVNSVKGELVEIGLFQIHLKDSQQDILVFPNNLLLQKPVKKIKPNAAGKLDKSTKTWLGRAKQKQL
ncbi:mechanosensitive ion channel family protein [Thiomicrospira microaerophila]|uniref:mechanosensitive ion channel family protein n=1 Tax=Thiomicrospira microaerophila TaxID=406020 RepID=UPI000696AEBD|nr:mechanosensitive ion channel domain-containing protein [Thiomicrospira microaerophila]